MSARKIHHIITDAMASTSQSDVSGDQNEVFPPTSPPPTARVSKTEKCGLVIPIPRIRAMLKVSSHSSRIGKDADIFLAGALNYVMAEIVELSLNEARSENRERIQSRDIVKAISNDEELRNFFEHSVFKDTGGIPSQSQNAPAEARRMRQHAFIWPTSSGSQDNN